MIGWAGHFPVNGFAIRLHRLAWRSAVTFALLLVASLAAFATILRATAAPSTISATTTSASTSIATFWFIIAALAAATAAVTATFGFAVRTAVTGFGVFLFVLFDRIGDDLIS